MAASMMPFHCLCVGRFNVFTNCFPNVVVGAMQGARTLDNKLKYMGLLRRSTRNESFASGCCGYDGLDLLLVESLLVEPVKHEVEKWRESDND